MKIRYAYNSFIYLPLAVSILISCSVITAKKSKLPARFSVLFAGDILLANEAERYIETNGNDYPFYKIKNELLKYDFIIANLETPITERGMPVNSKPYTFRINHDTAECLNDLKLDAVSIANNHLMDYGPEGMKDTLAHLKKINIRHAGGGDTLDEARRPVRLSYDGTDIIILAYNERPPAAFSASAQSAGIATLDIPLIKEDIETHRRNNNIVIVSLHWGIEHTIVPQTYQIALAHAIIDYGADAIIGHHPHWPQGIELYRGKPIVYSLGNFINGYINKIEHDNIAVVLYYNENILENIKILPVAGRNRQILFQPYILKGSKASALMELIKSLSREMKTEITIRDNTGIIDPHITISDHGTEYHVTGTGSNAGINNN
ncbi:MAG TPA: CapA family protein [Spirochaetota bacterium]|nr:CapA family protein [Spirochaetota bacterium]HQF10618.1 CapA family protein [Spirochaetota bacterium]HQH99597.1 CapA family protein [Spirochaetota bacterium]HQJ73181.1 CapA family protein [Spirochaetota bacterium]